MGYRGQITLLLLCVFTFVLVHELTREKLPPVHRVRMLVTWYDGEWHGYYENMTLDGQPK